MNEPGSKREGGGSRRQLNRGLLKTIIVFMSGLVAAMLSGLSGLAGQNLFAPMLTWMLGYAKEKAAVNALRFALYVCVGALISGGYLSGKLPSILLNGILIMLGETAGVLLGKKILPSERLRGVRPAISVIGMGLTLFVILKATMITPLNPTPYFAVWNQPWQLMLIGVVSGSINQATSFAGGTLWVPALYLLCGFPARESILTSLTIVLSAGLLPAFILSRTQLMDPVYALNSALSGLIGGACGGWLLLFITQRQDRFAIYGFGVIAMFLIARDLTARIVGPSQTE